MTTLDEIREHVTADAHELAATAGMVLPLLEDINANKEQERAIVFLREHLKRHLVLVVCRLHDAPSTRAGGTRVIASIRSLLESAKAEKRLTPEQVANFAQKRDALISSYDPDGRICDFRHREQGHSIHVSGHPPATLPIKTLWDFAHDTFELVLEIEDQLIRSGSDRIVDLDGKFHEWRDVGEKFWSSRSTANDMRDLDQLGGGGD